MLFCTCLLTFLEMMIMSSELMHTTPLKHRNHIMRPGHIEYHLKVNYLL